MDININNIIEMKSDIKYLFDFNNDFSKNKVTHNKYFSLFTSRIFDDICYFNFIQSYIFLNKNLEDKNYDLLYNIFEKFSRTLILSNDDFEKLPIAVNFFKNLHLLYLYFSNYPFLYGVLSDEEINEILSQFKPNMEESESVLLFSLGYKNIIPIVNDLCSQVNKGFSILNEKQKLKLFQKFLIEINLSNEQYFIQYNIVELIEFYQIKNYLRDIEFCLEIAIIDIINKYKINYPSQFEIYPSILNKDKRIKFYTLYTFNIQIQNKIFFDEQANEYNESIKYKETIVLGEQKFHNLIKTMNIPCENIYYLNENQFSKFFLFPKKINNKYKICKYIIIMNEIYFNKYMETIKYISNVFGLKFVNIIYIENKNVKINKKILQVPFIHTILTYTEKDILNYYYDFIIRLKEININFLLKDEQNKDKKLEINYQFPKLSETKIFREQDNGWDMIRSINENIFDLVNVVNYLGDILVGKFTQDMYKVYKENDYLDLFIKYYGNYFAGDYLVEQNPSLIAVIKLFSYAYTLEENDGKSFYLLMNNDLRSGNTEKICRYLFMFNNIYVSIKEKYLKSYNGDVYRATYFKKELIDEIKVGKKMLNASLWSSSKKLDVAKNFLFKYKKNILIHTKVKEGNNIDIHLEKLSQYPNEEEILFLPYCVFEIKSFNKTYENNLEYYKLELSYCEKENKSNKIENVKFKVKNDLSDNNF